MVNFEDFTLTRGALNANQGVSQDAKHVQFADASGGLSKPISFETVT